MIQKNKIIILWGIYGAEIKYTKNECSQAYVHQ